MSEKVLKVDVVMGQDACLSGSVFMLVESESEGVSRGSLLVSEKTSPNETVLMRSLDVKEEDIEIYVHKSVSLYSENGKMVLKSLNGVKFEVSKVSDCSAVDIFNYKEAESAYILHKSSILLGADEKNDDNIAGELEEGKCYELEIGSKSWGWWWHYAHDTVGLRVPCSEEGVTFKSLIFKVVSRFGNVCSGMFIGLRFETKTGKYYFIDEGGLSYHTISAGRKSGEEYLGAFIPKDMGNKEGTPAVSSVKEFNIDYTPEVGEIDLHSIPFAKKEAIDFCIYKVELSSFDDCCHFVDIKEKFALSAYGAKDIEKYFLLVKFEEDMSRGVVDGVYLQLVNGGGIAFYSLSRNVRVVRKDGFVFKGSEGVVDKKKCFGVSVLNDNNAGECYTV